MKPICIIVLLSVISCTTEEESPKVEPAIITITVKDTFPAAGRLWAFLTNSQGEVISSQKLSLGNNKFTGAAPDIINVTFLEYSIDTQNFYRFTTYPNVALNSVINMDQANGLGWYNTTNYPLSAKISVKFRGDNQYISTGNNKRRLQLWLYTVDAARNDTSTA